MFIRTRGIGLLLCWAAAASGQTWTLYAPPEGDFRVLFPATPTRAATADGAVAYSAAAENMTFTVFRRDPRSQPIGNPASDIQRRLRGDNDDMVIQRLGGKEGDARPDEYVFLARGVSIHHLFIAEGRYYEVVVRAPRDEIGRARTIARDFFGSFQIGSAPIVAGAPAAVAPDVICKGRSNAFSRSYCEYSTCLKSQHRAQPFCQNLLRFR
jgi:hypothetical protein